MKKLNYSNYQNLPLPKIYNDLSTKIIELSEKILRLKKIPFSKTTNIEKDLITIDNLLFNQIGIFSNTKGIIALYLNYCYEKENINYYENLVLAYNDLLSCYHKYLRLRRKISQSSYEKILKEEKEKLSKLLIKALSYNHIPITDCNDFYELLSKNDYYYQCLSEIFQNIKSIFESNFFSQIVPANLTYLYEEDPVELIGYLEKSAKIITSKEVGYKSYYYTKNEIKNSFYTINKYDNKIIIIISKLLSLKKIKHSTSITDKKLTNLIKKYYPHLTKPIKRYYHFNDEQHQILNNLKKLLIILQLEYLNYLKKYK